jgi:hypothetical protein
MVVHSMVDKNVAAGAPCTYPHAHPALHTTSSCALHAATHPAVYYPLAVLDGSRREVAELSSSPPGLIKPVTEPGNTHLILCGR